MAAAAVTVGAMVAAGCASNEALTVALAAAPEATSVAPDAPAPGGDEHPCDTGEGQIDGRYCLVDGRWWFDAGTGAWVESDGPPATTPSTVAAPEPEPAAAPEPDPEPVAGPSPAETATSTSVPAVVADEGLADRALAFLAGELGVPANEITPVGTEPVTWPDASLGCAKEGHAYIQVQVPGYRFTFMHDSVVHGVHSDEQGTNFVRPVRCYDPAEAVPTTTTAAPEPEITVPTSVPVTVDDLSLTDRALAFLASSLGVPESGITFTGIEPVAWPDASLGCPQEGYAYAQVLVPGYRLTFAHGAVSHDVHSDEQGTHFVRPVGCYDPSEPEPATTTTAPPTTTTTTAPPTTTTAAPEPEPTTTTTTAPQWPYGPPGTVVHVAEIWPDEGYAPDYVCEVNSQGAFVDDDGNQNCWLTRDVWTPPQAGDVPVPLPECSEDRSTWTSDCTPPSGWEWGEWEPGGAWPQETPRYTALTVGWWNWCLTLTVAGGGGVPCAQLWNLMKWPLDYLGANPECIDSEYRRRALRYTRSSNPRNSWSEDDGWANCATVIDPIVGTPPAGRSNDVGYRLSDTGLTLAERCRTVLPEDVMLETGGATPTRFKPGHAGCEAWAEWVEDVMPTTKQGCFRSFLLANEWMQHHHGVHQLYPVIGHC